MDIVKKIVRPKDTLITIPSKLAKKLDCDYMSATIDDNGNLVYKPVVV